MARPVYPHEMVDPDLQWLLSTYRESHPNVILVEISCLPVTLIYCPEAASLFEPGSVNTSPQEGFPANSNHAGDDVADEPDIS
jgi:hypothetical protein